MKRVLFLLFILCLASPIALAHSGVKNPAVMARMEAMKSIGSATKTVGDMARGKRDFDLNAARTALDTIAQEAGRVSDLFANPEDDPKSEALPAIWDDFSDFQTKNDQMQSTAATLASTVTTLDDLRAGLAQLGDTCSACHKLYRK